MLILVKELLFVLHKLEADQVPKPQNAWFCRYEDATTELKELHALLHIILLLKLLNCSQMQPLDYEFKSHRSDFLSEQEQGSYFEESNPVQKAVIAKRCYDTAEPEHFWIQLEFSHE